MTSKQLLIQSFDSSHYSNNSTYGCKRIGYNKLERTVEDILNMFKYADENNIRDTMPLFCIASLSRVPVIPDEMSDLASIRQDMNFMFQQMETPTSSVSSLVSVTSQTNAMCNDIQQSLHKPKTSGDHQHGHVMGSDDASQSVESCDSKRDAHVTQMEPANTSSHDICSDASSVEHTGQSSNLTQPMCDKQ